LGKEILVVIPILSIHSYVPMLRLSQITSMHPPADNIKRANGLLERLQTTFQYI